LAMNERLGLVYSSQNGLQRNKLWEGEENKSRLVPFLSLTDPFSWLQYSVVVSM